MSISFVRKRNPWIDVSVPGWMFFLGSTEHKEGWGILINPEIKDLDFANMVSDVFSWEELRFFFLKQIPWNMEIWREQWRLTADYTGRCLNPDVSPDFRVPLWTANHPIPITLFSVPWKEVLVLRILTRYDRMNKNEPCDACLCVIYTRVSLISAELQHLRSIKWEMRWKAFTWTPSPVSSTKMELVSLAQLCLF